VGVSQKQIFISKIRTIEELEQRIREDIAEIPEQMTLG
jgi:hypothetical protein